MLWVLIEVPCQGTSSEYLQHMFIKHFVVGTQMCLAKALLINTHNICFHGELEKIIPDFSSNTPP